ncbi:choice-of-anchor Q domain-containing protein [Marinicella sp. W31]|uniref:choice-of-anchor Q domain-containing protein n=1 Tax=Marinicella sp. W31 TaxID=3023713 RepID=UPI003757225D
MKQKKITTAITGLIGLSLFGMHTAQAGDRVIVNSTSDISQPGLTTLRQAVQISNVLPSAEIEFDAELFSVPQRITLINGDILISENIIIFGPGQDLLTIDGGNNSRIFRINNDDDSLISARINGLTLTNGLANNTTGREGGCILSFENLSLTNSTITQCRSFGNGGGIKAVSGSLTLNNSTVSNNSAGNNAGGVYLRQATAVISNSTISGNTADISGGGVRAFRNSDVEILNSTISNNVLLNAETIAGGGIYIKENTTPLSIQNSTVFNNTGEGIYIKDSSLVNINNSVIASNSLTDCDFSQINSNSDNERNIDTDGSCNVNASDHTTVADPMLEPLANYGGSTDTHRPKPSSPVIDTGDDALCLEFDQRGVIRPQDGDQDGTATCDIGAVELAAFEDVIFSNGFDD